MALSREDLTYKADGSGYMIFYKGKAIGGAGILKSAKLTPHIASLNAKMFGEDAERDICQILSDNEYLATRYTEKIKEIESEAKKNETMQIQKSYG